MPVYETTVTDTANVPVAGAQGYIYVGGVLASLTDDLGAPLANPIVSDALGYAKATVPSAPFTVKWRWLGKERLIETYLEGGIDSVLRADLAADTGAALVGTATGGTVQSDLNARVTTADLASTATGKGAALVKWKQSGTGAVDRTVLEKLREHAVSVADYSTVAEAVATGKDVFFPAGAWPFGQLVVTTQGQRFFGEGPASIVRAIDATKDLFLVRAADVNFFGLRLEGASTSETNGTFAIKTDVAYPAPRLRVEDCVFSGEDSTKGFNNGVKFDTGADSGLVHGCHFERLWGNDSGYGYGVLCGDVDAIIVTSNSGVGTSGRGRHFCYLSGGASYCKVTHNHVIGFDSDAITLFSYDAQPAVHGNIIADNTILNPITTPAFYNAGISLFLNCNNNKIVNNIIVGSGGKGINIDGTDSTKLVDNSIIGNTIINSQYIGIDVISAVGGEISGNRINESSLAAAGTYANIRLVSDGTTATSGVLVAGNRSSGSTYSRSAFQINSTAPTPTGLKVYGNKFDMCNAADVELGGVACAIDGRIRFAQAGVSYGPIANGAALSTAYTVNGADQGDIVNVGHTSNCDGCSVTAYANGTNAVTVTVLNNSGGSKTIASGTLQIDVWKRTP